MRPRLPAIAASLTWAAVIGTMLAVILARYRDIMRLPALGKVLGPDDPDPWLRLVQVRQWLVTGDFYNHAVAGTNAPFGGITTPWTRPFDVLLAFFLRLTPSEYFPDTRLMIAGAWLPPLLGLVALFFLWRAAAGYFRHTHSLWCLVMLAALNPVLLYFQPGATDHHALLIALWCGVLCLVARPMNVKQGALAGVALGIMLWVSPEALLLIGAVYALLGIEALKQPDRSAPLAAMAVSAAAICCAALPVEMPLTQIFATPVYDTLSLPYAVAMALAASGAVLLWLLRGETTRLRLQAVIATGAVALAGMLVWFPKFFHGPLVDVDAYVLSDFLPNVAEAQPLSAQGMLAFIVHLWQPMLAAFLFYFGGRRRKRLGVLLLVTLIMTLASARWTYYMQPVALLLAASILPGWAARVLKFAPRLTRPYIFLAGVILALGICIGSMPVPESAPLAACRADMRYVLQSGQLVQALGRDDMVVMTSPDVSGQMLFFTPYRIIAGNYHREGEGMRALAGIIHAKDAVSARPLLGARKVGALLLCAPATYPAQSWLHHLTAEAHPAWLTPAGKFTFPADSGAHPALFVVK